MLNCRRANRRAAHSPDASALITAGFDPNGLRIAWQGILR
jgi:hypothetical protein